MTNKIETLRALCFTAEDFKTIPSCGYEFSTKDIEFMVEFKKIYELGTDQLKKFLTKLENEGNELDTYSILYYVSTLSNGPFSEDVKSLTSNRKYFKPSPDSMGCLKNLTRCPQNISTTQGSAYPLGCSVDSYNKLPPIIQTVVSSAIRQTEEVFRNSVKGSMIYDNTLPLVDKQSEERYGYESMGGWEKRANGNYMVKDTSFYVFLERMSSQINGLVKTYLGDEDFRIYTDKKNYNPFTAESNESTATNLKITKTVKDRGKSRKVDVDIMGDVFESDEKRASELVITTPEGSSLTYRLNTNSGQLET